MLGLEKLWTRALLCSRMVCIFCGYLCGSLCPAELGFVYHAALGPADGLLSIVDRLTWGGGVSSETERGTKPTGGPL